MMRKVVTSRMDSGRGSLLGPDTRRRVRWWTCTLDCGHIEQPRVRYAKRRIGASAANGWHPRTRAEVLPAPKRVKCGACASAAKRAKNDNDGG